MCRSNKLDRVSIQTMITRRTWHIPRYQHLPPSLQIRHFLKGNHILKFVSTMPLDLVKKFLPGWIMFTLCSKAIFMISSIARYAWTGVYSPLWPMTYASSASIFHIRPILYPKRICDFAINLNSLCLCMLRRSSWLFILSTSLRIYYLMWGQLTWKWLLFVMKVRVPELSWWATDLVAQATKGELVKLLRILTVLKIWSTRSVQLPPNLILDVTTRGFHRHDVGKSGNLLELLEITEAAETGTDTRVSQCAPPNIQIPFYQLPHDMESSMNMVCRDGIFPIDHCMRWWSGWNLRISPRFATKRPQCQWSNFTIAR